MEKQAFISNLKAKLPENYLKYLLMGAGGLGLLGAGYGLGAVGQKGIGPVVKDVNSPLFNEDPRYRWKQGQSESNILEKHAELSPKLQLAPLSTLEKIQKAMYDAAQTAGDSISNLGNKANLAALNAWDYAGNAIESAKKGISNLGNKANLTAMNAWHDLGEVASQTGQELGGAGKFIGKNLKRIGVGGLVGLSLLGLGAGLGAYMNRDQKNASQYSDSLLEKMAQRRSNRRVRAYGGQVNPVKPENDISFDFSGVKDGVKNYWGNVSGKNAQQVKSEFGKDSEQYQTAAKQRNNARMKTLGTLGALGTAGFLLNEFSGPNERERVSSEQSTLSLEKTALEVPNFLKDYWKNFSGTRAREMKNNFGENSTQHLDATKQKNKTRIKTIGTIGALALGAGMANALSNNEKKAERNELDELTKEAFEFVLNQEIPKIEIYKEGKQGIKFG